MIPVVPGLWGRTISMKYLHDECSREAYQWIRLDELILKMCSVSPLTAYGAIGTHWHLMAPMVALVWAPDHSEVSTRQIQSSSISEDSA